MSNSTEARVIRKFRRRLEQGELDEKVKVIHRVEGGLPSERLVEELHVSGKGRARASRFDTLNAIDDHTAELDLAETKELLHDIESTLNDLIPPSEASFGPDSVVGSITIEVDGETATFLFDPGEPEEGRLVELAELSAEPTRARPKTAAELISDPVRKLSKRIHSTSSRLIERGKEVGNG